jgi:hypothetical protein
MLYLQSKVPALVAGRSFLFPRPTLIGQARSPNRFENRWAAYAALTIPIVAAVMTAAITEGCPSSRSGETLRRRDNLVYLEVFWASLAEVRGFPPSSKSCRAAISLRLG